MLTLALLVVAGIGTGMIGYLTGLASIVSYPALLAAGLSPVAANVSNTVALVGIGAGTTARRLADLAEEGRASLWPQLALSAAGGLLGGAALLVGGDAVFAAIVPALVALSSVWMLAAPRIRRLRGDRVNRRAYLLGLLGIGVYGGYCGAGAGVVFLALALTVTAYSFDRAMILKSVSIGVANAAASALFIVRGTVHWPAAIALGIGCVIGGNIAPIVQRLLPEPLLRWGVALAGLGLAIWLAVR